MATSRLARIFGRGRDDRADRAPDDGTGGEGPPSHPVPGPVVTRARYDEAVRRRRAADDQVGVFERFEGKLTAQIHEATEAQRHDYVRELLSRRIAVRARLEEAAVRRDRMRRFEEQLGASLGAGPGAGPGAGH